MKNWTPTLVALAAAWLAMAATAVFFPNEYLFFAGVIVLQAAILATGWNILGGFCGYVNFGASAFLAVGAYAAAFVSRLLGLDLAAQVLVAAVCGCALGAAVGQVALRLNGIYFAIATVAIAVVLQTVAFHWDYMGGARGVSAIPVSPPGPFASYNRYLFVVFSALLLAALLIARWFQVSWVGAGLRALRDDEVAAEASGVPTLRLKLLAATCSGGVMAAAGAPQLAFANVLEPASAFSLNTSISALAMSIIGGTSHWVGPLIGALLLGSLQQLTTVTLSSELNLLLLGLLLVVFVVAAPHGVVGLLTLRKGRE